MDRSKFIRIKICCISTVQESSLAVKHGASAIGLVSEMPSGPGVIDDDLISEIVRVAPPPVATFLLTSKTNGEEIIDQQRKTGASTLQLVDHVQRKELKLIRKNLPAVKIVQVIHVTGEESIEDARRVEPYVDALLLDSGNPNLDVKVLGGTGKQHNWDISLRIRRLMKVPLFLAGGLNPQNAAEAIAKVGPYGLDICSGIRTNGMLDENKLRLFFGAINKFNLYKR